VMAKHAEALVDESPRTEKPVTKKLESLSHSDTVRVRRREPSKFHLILFGLFIYLLGHALTIWAFLAGNFGAWTIGNFCSVGGVAIAIVSVVQALRQIETRLLGPPPKRGGSRNPKAGRSRTRAARKPKSQSVSS